MPRGSSAAIGALIWLVALLSAATPAWSRLVRLGEVARLPEGSVAAPAALTLPVRFSVALASRDPVGLARLAQAVSTPGSPWFRRYLSAPQFARQFGASPAAVAAVSAYLRHAGLTVRSVAQDRLVLSVEGDAAQVERALFAPLVVVRHPIGIGRSAVSLGYANARPPALPAGLARDVTAIIGLDQLAREGPAGLAMPAEGLQRGRAAAARPRSVPRQSAGPRPCGSVLQDNSARYGSLTADMVAAAYGFSSLYGLGDQGQGQKVAVLEEQAYDPEDVMFFQRCYETSAPVVPINVDGGPTASYQPPPVGTGDAEAALDIEQVISVAPAAAVLVYQGPPGSSLDILSRVVSQDLAKVVSISYGLCEPLAGLARMRAENTLLQEAAVQGQSVFVASGDAGSTACYGASADAGGSRAGAQLPSATSLAVLDPAGQPFATAVGGTALYAKAGMNDIPYRPPLAPVQSVWNDGISSSGQPEATGGGVSSTFRMPTYQAEAPRGLGVRNARSTSAPCRGGRTLCREVPDVAADADPSTGYDVLINGNWTVEGGTSAAAPLWAGFMALTDALPQCRGLSVGFANPSLYRLAGREYARAFTDVSLANPFTGQSSNDVFYGSAGQGIDPRGLYPVTRGYDMTTGLGSMLAPQLASALCGLRSPAYSVTVQSPGPQTGALGQPISTSVVGHDSGWRLGARLTYSAFGLPAGLAISRRSGRIHGRLRRLGRSLVTIIAADQFGNVAATRFSWTVLRHGIPQAAVTLTGAGSRAPMLRLSMQSGFRAPRLRSVSIYLPGGITVGRATAGLVVSGGARVSRDGPGDRLTLSWRSPVAAASMRLGRPALVLSARIVRALRRHRLPSLVVRLRVVDARGRLTRLAELVSV